MQHMLHSSWHQDIEFRHKAYNWLKSHKNDMDSSVCKAPGRVEKR